MEKKLVALTKCRRGGQPGNSNARKHELYAARNSHPKVHLFQYTAPKVLSSGKESAPQILYRKKIALMNNRLKLSQIHEIMEELEDSHEFFAWLRVLVKIIATNSKLALEICKLEHERDFLPSLARNASYLINCEFKERRISEHTIFVPLGLENFSANLGSGGPILTDNHWLLIKQTFDTLELDYFRKYKRHKPCHDPRFLMEGILLKLAYDVKWDAVPGLMYTFHPKSITFPVRAAQQLYRQLYLSGRMQAIYKELHWHLDVYGDTNLENLVEQGTFQIRENKVCLASKHKLTWQKFTALLLLQRALHNYRSLKREQDAERRGQGHYIRVPSFPRKSKKQGHPETQSNLFPIETNDIAHEPLEKSMVSKKWKIQKRINDIGRA